ncbi:TOG array regulator of axonemal microtubules protein 2 isoform X1 [Rhineura floridana]|uniref:TOG array regulator of axonemal microtubules protein 2 isoform X1 n=2 Tax=Rhineura floridana TaxID=261503 RepID=UPI002AC81490|nr:TOG array regulator of axonemal microtubules protein 2 isoform X1 [Rhineura floridana]XP_061480945.1 TOG array regulator of axonemal microtubules protein 2 isoform X1 [Rhineura floridana]XP_061480947.1 TOG array regulator of axonemal microtubules protein 2 isoform X1 [Rhineura floridana]XP_061480948.1 TOG array regulator of axonemal microtubules protein 2 isoform X1 [Rhineura floridana]
MATNDEFTAAKHRAPVAIYCGSVPKAKPGCRSLRGGSIDSNLQLCGNGWMTADDASLHSVLKKQTCLWGGKGKPLDISPLENWDSRNGLQKKNTDSTLMADPSQLPSPLTKQKPGELEVSNAAVETAQIKDKLKKRRISEGIHASSKGLLDSSGPQGLALKPAISKSASQRLLITSKPMPPIQSIPTSPEANGHCESEHKVLGNGTNCLEVGGYHSVSTAVTQEILHGHDENLKRYLGVALIPPIPKSAKEQEENSQNFQELLQGSSQFLLESAPLAAEESFETRSKLMPCNTERNILNTLETRNGIKNGMSESLKAAMCPPESVLPLTISSLSLPKEGGQFSSPCLLKDEWKESNGRIHVTIAKSAQEKMRQKQLKEIEILHKEREKEKDREKERFMKFQDQLQKTACEGSGPLKSNATTPVALSLSNPCRAPVGMALKKRVNRPSLPSIPVINHDSSFLRHASANSLPANLPSSPEWEEDLVNRDTLETRPLSYPEQGLVDALKWLNSNDWHLKEKGLFSIRCLATCHSEVLQCRLHDVSLAATKEVSNLRSKVSRFAIGTLTELFKAMKKHMDQEVEEISRVLLQKAGDTSEFIQKAADQSLGVMAQNVTPPRAMAALMANGVNHRNPLVRKCAAEHLLTIVEQIGAEKLLSGNRDNTELLVQTLVKLAQDCNQDTRFYGRKMLNILMSHSKFDGYLKHCLPSHDLRDVMAAIKQKGTEDQVSQAPSAKSHRGSKNSSLTTSLDSLPSDEGSVSDVLGLPQAVTHRSSLRSIEIMEQSKELNKMLMAKEFQIRMEGVTLLMEHCKNNPQLVSSNIIQIFDAFIPRLQDSNKKVNQYALESVVSMIPILKDGLNPVLVSVVTVVTDNLNSKNSGIYNAAVKVLDKMIIHLDNLLLLQTFASRVRFIGGQALQDITARLSVLVGFAYPRKSQVVERHILPILWYFLSNMIGNGVLPGKSGNVKTVVSKLAKSLHKQMGPKLEEYASSQPQHVIKTLQDLLDMKFL